MPEIDDTPSGPVRVKDTDTGDEYTVAAIWSPETQKVIDKPAASSDGRHYPAKYNVGARSASKESK